MAFGGSTNTVLHLTAIAQEAGHPITMDDWDAASARTPHLVKLQPSGPRPLIDLYAVGGVPVVMHELAEAGPARPQRAHVSWAPWTSTWKTAPSPPTARSCRTHDNPFSTGGRPARAARQRRSRRRHREEVGRRPVHARAHGPGARASTPRKQACEAIFAGKINPGDVVVIRYEGPAGGPGMREMLTPTCAICGHGSFHQSVALHHRRPLLRRLQGPVRGSCQPRGRGRRPHRADRGRRSW